MLLRILNKTDVDFCVPYFVGSVWIHSCFHDIYFVDLSMFYFWTLNLISNFFVNILLLLPSE
jgi:hypothetical protein